jgi:hypothetical protein
MMKTCILLGLLALALLALPAAVAAETASTVITGSVTTSLSVTVDDTALNLGAMDVGYNPASPGYVTTSVHVTSSGPITGWALTAKDTNTIVETRGYLLDGTTKLANPLGFTWGIGTPGTWTDLTATRDIASDVLYPFPGYDTDVFFRQEVVTGDPVGSYTMTVQFNLAEA